MPAPLPPGYLTPAQLAKRWGCGERSARETARRLGVELRQRRTFQRGGAYRLEDVRKAEEKGWY